MKSNKLKLDKLSVSSFRTSREELILKGGAQSDVYTECIDICFETRPVICGTIRGTICCYP
ncbi:hypothetical protein AB9P05_09215 [Roseivirga sp. BDSF3-8]|uniref:hypothetical protein n=1 Tax=Roseivirga sp. BDSF3-8 TaxID=3241598 RepID=UPI003532565D